MDLVNAGLKAGLAMALLIVMTKPMGLT